MCWSHGNITNNKLNKIIKGNKNKGYNIGLWNCRRGLITDKKSPSTKMTEIMQFLAAKNLHLLCVVESDIHSQKSRYRNRQHLNTQEVHDILGISGYRILLPKSWQIHGQARIILFAKDELKVKVREISLQNSDLPTISLEISLGNEKPTVVNYFYREFTGAISSLNDLSSQNGRLIRQINIWKQLCLEN